MAPCSTGSCGATRPPECPEHAYLHPRSEVHPGVRAKSARQPLVRAGPRWAGGRRMVARRPGRRAPRSSLAASEAVAARRDYLALVPRPADVVGPAADSARARSGGRAEATRCRCAGNDKVDGNHHRSGSTSDLVRPQQPVQRSSAKRSWVTDCASMGLIVGRGGRRRSASQLTFEAGAVRGGFSPTPQARGWRRAVSLRDSKESPVRVAQVSRGPEVRRFGRGSRRGGRRRRTTRLPAPFACAHFAEARRLTCWAGRGEGRIEQYMGRKRFGRAAPATSGR
jgi:hypothetical protein